jgi:hypothetical protein
MEILETSEHKHTISLPPECIDPASVKIGKTISYTVHGKVKAIDEKFGVTIELSDENEEPTEEDKEDFESMEPEEQTKHMKKNYGNKNKLEEY